MIPETESKTETDVIVTYFTQAKYGTITFVSIRVKSERRDDRTTLEKPRASRKIELHDEKYWNWMRTEFRINLQ